jgi:hypothetical protein
MELPFGLLLGAAWGAFVAWAIRKTEIGLLLANYMMWLVVSIGVGVDMLIALWLFSTGGWVYWPYLIALLAVSATPLALVSLNSKLIPMLRVIFHGLKDTST